MCFFIPETTKGWEYIGKIKEVEEAYSNLVFTPDPQLKGEYHMKTSHLNLEAAVVYALDEIDEDADLTEKPETKFPQGTLIKSILINKANPLIEKGWVIHETYEETVTLLKYPDMNEN